MIEARRSCNYQFFLDILSGVYLFVFLYVNEFSIFFCLYEDIKILSYILCRTYQDTIFICLKINPFIGIAAISNDMSSSWCIVYTIISNVAFGPPMCLSPLVLQNCPALFNKTITKNMFSVDSSVHVSIDSTIPYGKKTLFTFDYQNAFKLMTVLAMHQSFFACSFIFYEKLGRDT